MGGKRRFDPATVGRVSFIRRAQEAGFTLDEIQMILDDDRGGWHSLVEDKLITLKQRAERVSAR